MPKKYWGKSFVFAIAPFQGLGVNKARPEHAQFYGQPASLYSWWLLNFLRVGNMVRAAPRSKSCCLMNRAHFRVRTKWGLNLIGLGVDGVFKAGHFYVFGNEKRRVK